MMDTRPIGLVATERRRRIAELVRDRGSVRASELTDLFGVTDETIRRDLTQLADLGVLNRAHGGAIAPTHAESDLALRLREHEAEKVDIAQAAAELVNDGSTIIVDSGSTAVHFVRALKSKRDLIVVTNAVTNAVELMDSREITVVLTGGVVRPVTYGAVGDFAVATLAELRVDQTFLAINSISIKGGLTYPSFEEVAVKRAMIAAAAEVILLADHSKFGRESLVRVAPIDVLTAVVTSGGSDPETLAALREHGVKVIVAAATQEGRVDAAS
jgi:DeoR family fructose operon transcriptional repressor